MSTSSDSPRRRRRGRRRGLSWRAIARALALPVTLVAAMGVAYWFVADRPPSLDSHLEQAELSGEQGNQVARIAHLKRAIAIDPNDPSTRWALGKAWLELRDGRSAFKELERARALGLDSAPLREDRFHAMLLSQEFNAVLVQTALLSDPREVEALAWMRAQAELGLGRSNSAKNLYLAIVQRDPNDLHAQLGLARIAMLEGEHDEAAVRLNTVMELDSGSVDGFMLLGELGLVAGNFAEARRAFESALERVSPNPRARLGLSRVDIETGRYVRALGELDAILADTPNHPLASYLKAEATWRLGDKRNALSVLYKTLSLTPNHVPSLVLLGWIHYLGDELEQSERALNRALANSVEPIPAAMRTLAAVHLRREQSAQAITILEDLLTTDPDAATLSLLAHAKIQDGDIDAGNALLAQAREAAPNQVEIRTQVALGHLSAGAASESASEFEAAIALSPDQERLRLLLVVAKLRDGKFQAALTSAQKIVAEDGGNAVAHYFSGLAQEALGDQGAAFDSFEKALSIRADFLAAADRLAERDVEQDNLEAARSRYRPLLNAVGTARLGALRMARLDASVGQPAKAKAWLEQLPRAVQLETSISVKLAALEASAGDLDSAFSRLAQASKRDPQSVDALRVLSEFELRRGNVAEAARLIEEASRIAPTDPQVLRTSAHIFLADRQSDAAYDAARAYAQLNDRSAEAHYGLGVVSLRRGDRASATSSFTAAIALEPDHLGARTGLALLTALDNNFADALKQSATLGESGRGNNRVAEQLLTANVLQLQGEYAQVVAILSPLAQINDDPTVVMALARALNADGKIERALQVLREWSEQRPTDAKIWAAIAQLHLEFADHANAILAYEKLLSVQPLNATALNNVAWLYTEAGDQRGIEYAQRAYELDPQRPEFADTFGWALVQAEHLERGATLLERAARRAPNAPSIQYHHAVGLGKVGDITGAREILVPLLQSGTKFPERAEARAFLASLRSR
ncbi:MAG: XrtA/PEP-CTERM system TPR-repeat protein PrsT [Pseudomonadota bacterium]